MEKLERLCKEYEKEKLCNVIKAIKATKEIEFLINSYEFVVRYMKINNKSKVANGIVKDVVQVV